MTGSRGSAYWWLVVTGGKDAVVTGGNPHPFLKKLNTW